MTMEFRNHEPPREWHGGEAELLDLTDDAFIVWDFEGGIRYWNSGAERLYGFSREEALGRESHDLLGTRFPQSLAATLAELRQNGRWEGEVVHTTRTGGQLTVGVVMILRSRWDRKSVLEVNRDITERKAAEQVLLRSEERRSLALNAAEAGTWEWEVATGRNTWSPELWKLYGLEPDSCEPSFKAWLQIVDPEDRERVRAELEESVGRKAELSLEWRVRRTEGDARWLLSRGRPECDASGRLLRYLGVVMDISARRRAEAGLRQWADAFENCTHGIAMGRPDSNRVLVCNPALARMLGRPVSEIAGAPILSLHAPEERDRVRACLAESDQSGHVHFESRMVRSDGSVFPVQTDVVSVRDASGALCYRVATVQDITARRRAEECLRDSEARLRLALQAAEQGLYDLDLRTGEALVSPEYALMLGYDPDTFRETTPLWLERLHPDDRERMLGVFGDYVAGRIPDYSVEFRQRTRSGEWKWTLSIGRIVERDAEGKPVRMLGTHTDVTALKRAEEEIRQLNETLEQRVRDRTAQLEAANRELESFSYSVSHDLRAPLRAVNGYVNFLQEDYSGRLDAEGNRLLGVVRSEAERMGRLIDDLLAFSRLGRQEMKHARIDMDALVRAVFESLCAGLTTPRPRLVLKPLPPAQGDPSMVRQVLVNLLGNAIKFSSREAAPVIEVGTEDAAGQPAYYVKDNGVGFDERYSHKLFGVFQRLHSEEEFAGTGVGLALVQRVIHRHGGTVRARSRPGQGATFHFTLSSPPEPGHAQLP